jgi:hypothetical protein
VGGVVKYLSSLQPFYQVKPSLKSDLHEIKNLKNAEKISVKLQILKFIEDTLNQRGGGRKHSPEKAYFIEMTP